MLKALLVSVALLFSSATFACDQIQNIQGLSKEQKQLMVVECEKQRLAKITEKPVEQVTTPQPSLVDSLNEETITKVGAIAKTAGQVVKEVAKELNVAVNDFIKTPVGMITAGLAIWYVAGENITDLASSLWDVVGGIVIIILSLQLPTYFRRRVILKEETTEVRPILWGLFNTTKTTPMYQTWEEMGEGTAFFFLCSYLATIIGVSVGVSILF